MFNIFKVNERHETSFLFDFELGQHFILQFLSVAIECR